jgi:membrane protease YdiL (CAAX protease family)
VPSVCGIQFLMVKLGKFMDWPTQDHPFAELGKGSLYPVEWGLLIFAAIVVAPVWEEFLFRGLVQPWVLSRPYGGWAVLGVALTWTLATRMDRLSLAAAQGRGLFVELLPVVVLIGLVPLYAALREQGEPAAGLFSTAVLFAWVHVRVWPSPIPLLLLALGLGWLAYRTRNLVGSILVHSLFNGVACLLLLLRPSFLE